MEEQSCPRCKTTSYRNKHLKLLVNVCGHKLCQTCVDVLFTRPSAACPICGMALRRSDYREQQFEDSKVEREVDIRKRIVKIYNQREEDFESLKDYNDYLEEIETIIFNLANKVDEDETKRRVEAYKKENDKQIKKNNSKLNQEEALLKASLELEKQGIEERRKKLLESERDIVKQKKKEKESLINDLIYANVPAEEVIARHAHLKRQQEEEEKEKKSFFFSEKNKNTLLVNKPVIQAPLYEYKAPDIKWFGPMPPSETDVSTKGYLTHIRSATLSEAAGGYTESLACRRALQEAFDCMFI